MDPEDKDYVCTLTEYSLKKAMTELNEDPKQRLGAVQALRAWIRAQPHFTFRTDTNFLLQVLRTAKFSQLRAREIIETMITARTKYPQYMVNLDSHEPGILRFFERGYLIPLPKSNDEGQRLFLARFSALDLSDPMLNVVNEMRASLASQELLNEDNENGIVNGAHVVFDMTGVTMKHITRSGSTEQRNFSKMLQECSIGRMKGFHLYNVGSLVEVVVGLMKTFFKKKFVDRIHVHSTMESLYKLFPMDFWPIEYLPDDYKGPSAGSIKDISEDMVRRLKDPVFRAKLLDVTHERYKIDYSKKDNNAPQESFRKLNIE